MGSTTATTRRPQPPAGVTTRLWRLLAGLLVVVAAAAAFVAAPVTHGTAAAAPAALTYTYEVRGLDNNTNLADFAASAAGTFHDPRGWSLGGPVEFVRVPSGGDFTLWLAAAWQMPSFGAGCDSTWSCRIGRNVVVNETRWTDASPAWNASGRSLADYRALVVNHEVGHWLGFGHATCSGPGALAPLMQQQSIDLQGCRPNPWPLPGERRAAAVARGLRVASTVGSLDEARDDGNGVRVRGWALDFDTSAPIDVDVYLDGGFAGRYRADASRDDLAALYPETGPAHGFDVLVPAGPGSHTVAVYAISAGLGGPGSTNPLLGTRQVTLASPFGHLDLAVGGFDALRVAGWAIDPDTPAPIAVHVYVDGVGVAAVTADGARPDLAAAFPGSGHAHGFDVTVRAGTGRHTVAVYAINVGGGGNTVLGSRTVDLTADPVGGVDLAGAQGDQIRVAGWALDPDTVGPVTVHAYVDGVFVAQAPADGARADIAAAYPAYGSAHGFDLLLPASDGTHTVDVYAINAGNGTVNVLLGRRTVTVRTVPFGNVEVVSPQVGQIRVAGWAIDPDRAAPIAVHVYVDGTKAAEAVAAIPRGDLAAAFPASGADHGFDLTVAVSGGPHLVHVYAINTGPGTANPLIGAARVTTGGNPFGRVDDVTASPDHLHVRGWALDPDSSAPVEVHVYVDGVLRSPTTAAVPRADVAATFPGAGPDHGFDLDVPVANGVHLVQVYALNRGTGTANTVIGARTVTVG